MTYINNDIYMPEATNIQYVMKKIKKLSLKKNDGPEDKIVVIKKLDYMHSLSQLEFYDKHYLRQASLPKK